MSEWFAPLVDWYRLMPQEEAVRLVRLAIAFVLCLGAVVGSFLNVCIYRIPLGQSVSRPRSHCFSCGKTIPWYLNVPILSWIVLRGRCANCHAPISVRYPVIEALTAVLFLLVFQMWANPRLFLLDPIPGQAPALILFYWLFVASVVVDVMIDIDHRILLDRISLGGTLIALAVSAAFPILHGAASWWPALLASLGGAAVGFGAGFAIAWAGERIFLQDAFGFGDVKWLMLFGALFGWRGALFILMLAAFVGLAMGLVALAAARFRRAPADADADDGAPLAIPFGPALGAAALLWLFWGNLLVDGFFAAHAWAFAHRTAVLAGLVPLLLLACGWLLFRIRAIRRAAQDDALEELPDDPEDKGV